MDDKMRDYISLAALAALMQGVRYLRRRRGELISIPTIMAAMLMAAIVGILVSVGLDYLRLDRRMIMISVAISGYLGGTLLETVADGVVATTKKHLHMMDKNE